MNENLMVTQDQFTGRWIAFICIDRLGFSFWGMQPTEEMTEGNVGRDEGFATRDEAVEFVQHAWSEFMMSAIKFTPRASNN